MLRVLTAAQMREADRQTVELGFPEAVLMENAGHRVVEFVTARFAPLSEQRIVIFCGKGNNGGDGYVIARQLWTRYRPASLDVIAAGEQQITAPRKMLEATGCPVKNTVTPEMHSATLVIDAVLGTGLTGPARGDALNVIRQINSGFPLASVVAVDVPSGMNSDSGTSDGDVARADATVTFTGPKLCHVLAPNCNHTGELLVRRVGTPDSVLDDLASAFVPEASDIAPLFRPRNPDSNKGTYGHVLVVGGAEGKSGAAEMAGLAALKAGAGLVTVASSAKRPGTLELMTASLPSSAAELQSLMDKYSVIAIGPGLGISAQITEMVLGAIAHGRKPLVIDADGLNVIAGKSWKASGTVVITPHPGEMARLAGKSIPEVQADRLGIAREFADEHGCTVVLKGSRTVIAIPGGRTWINPTGSPSMSTGGTGDILTGLIAGLIAQHHSAADAPVVAAVWLHGRAGEIGARSSTEQSLIATDLLRYLPRAIRDCQNVSDDL